MFLSFHERCIVSDLCAHHPAVVAILELQRDYSGKRITMKEMVEVITSCVQDPATVRNPTHTFKRGVEGWTTLRPKNWNNSKKLVMRYS